MPVAGASPLLGPLGIYGLYANEELVGLCSWTLVMEGWMYAGRIPALQNSNVNINPEMTTAQMNAGIPRHIQWKADNYNHLHEQPTKFYAIILALIQLKADDRTTVNLAWGYVGLRVIHSLVQSIANPIMKRFYIFATSSLVLAGLTGRAAMLLLK